MNSPALAHVTGAGGGGSAVGPLILLAVAIVFLLVFVGQKEWRSLKARRDNSDNSANSD